MVGYGRGHVVQKVRIMCDRFMGGVTCDLYIYSSCLFSDFHTFEDGKKGILGLHYTEVLSYSVLHYQHHGWAGVGVGVVFEKNHRLQFTRNPKYNSQYYKQ